MHVRRFTKLQIVRTILTVAGLVALVWFGAVQTHRANLLASRYAPVSEPRQQLKQSDKQGSASDDQNDDVSKIVGIATLIVLLVQSWISSRQAGIMLRQADLMDGQLKATERAASAAARANEFSLSVFKATQRPWVSIVSEEVASPLLLEGNKSVVTLGLTLKNTGSIPAFRVSVWPKIYFVGYGGIHPIAVRREFMEPLQRMPAHPASAGHVLFSGDELRTETAFHINQAQVKRMIGDQKSSTLIAIAVIHYQSGIGENEHRTATIFYLHRRTEDGWTIDFDPRAGSIDVANLKISRHPMGTIAD